MTLQTYLKHITNKNFTLIKFDENNQFKIDKIHTLSLCNENMIINELAPSFNLRSFFYYLQSAVTNDILKTFFNLYYTIDKSDWKPNYDYSEGFEVDNATSTFFELDINNDSEYIFKPFSWKNIFSSYVDFDEMNEDDLKFNLNLIEMYKNWITIIKNNKYDDFIKFYDLVSMEEEFGIETFILLEKNTHNLINQIKSENKTKPLENNDWIIYENKPYQVIEISQIRNAFIIQNYSNELIEISLNKPVKYWKPEEGDMCWFWNIEEDESITYILGKFSMFSEVLPEKVINQIDKLNKIEHMWEFCEPFIKQVPTFY